MPESCENVFNMSSIKGSLVAQTVSLRSMSHKLTVCGTLFLQHMRMELLAYTKCFNRTDVI